jgi:hypothetical protein
VAREIGPAPAAAPQADGSTIGLWRFDDCNGERVADLSARRADAVLVRTLNEYHETGIWPRTKHGGMSAALQPMPPAGEVSRERRLLAQTIADLDLKSVSTAHFRDGVLRFWLTEYENWRSNIYAPGQLEYPQSRALLGGRDERHRANLRQTGTGLGHGRRPAGHNAAAHGGVAKLAVPVPNRHSPRWVGP